MEPARADLLAGAVGFNDVPAPLVDERVAVQHVPWLVRIESAHSEHEPGAKAWLAEREHGAVVA